VHQTLNRILYVPLQKKNFDTVEINIMKDTEVPVPFRYGKAFIVLEFRRTIHAYLGLQKGVPTAVIVICYRNDARVMKQKVYCCDATHVRRLLLQTAGGEIPVFIGSRYQRGHGLGSVLGGLFPRFVIPLFRTHGKTLALDAVRTGMDVA